MSNQQNDIINEQKAEKIYFTDDQIKKVLAFLWDSLKMSERSGLYGQDLRQTGYGDRSKLGLINCLEAILNDDQSEPFRPIFIDSIKKRS